MDPLLLLAIPAGIVFVVVASRRGQSPQLDPQRLFDAVQKDVARRRCGNRCEHKPLLWKRCPGKAEEADHIYPWSRGGATSLGNLQYLCRRHNRRKSAWTPPRTYIWRLERRRRKYFPDGETVKVTWKLGAAPAVPPTPAPARRNVSAPQTSGTGTRRT